MKKQDKIEELNKKIDELDRKLEIVSNRPLLEFHNPLKVFRNFLRGAKEGFIEGLGIDKINKETDHE